MSDQQDQEIEFLGEKTIGIKKNQTILDAALEAGLPHFHACGGNAECSTCRILVVEGLEGLTPVNEAEASLRSNVPFPPKIRLACQTGVEHGPVKIKRIILDRTDLSSPVKEKIADEHCKLGEKRELVLFFLDIRNFTPFVETYLPFDVIHVMRGSYIIFNDMIRKHQGIIIDTAGDGFYAVFGMNCSTNTAASQAIDAGYAILEEFGKFNETYLHPYFGMRLDIGIGVHCGQVIVGEVMVGQKSHLSVMGLAVSIAARIQNSTKKLNNNFIASDDVVQLSGRGNTGEKRVVKMKGVNHVHKVRLIGSPYEALVH
jgi:adenylate cyclase